MRITGTYSPRLLLKAQAPFLRLLTALVEQFTYRDLQDAAESTDVLNRIVSYLRELAHAAAAEDSPVIIRSVKQLVEAANLIDAATRNSGKGLSDAAVLIESVALRFSRTVSDFYLATDSQTRSPGKVFSDATPPRDYPALTPHPVLADLLGSPADSVPVLSATLRWQESGQYVEGYGDYVDETYFLKTPQALDIEFLLSAGKGFVELVSPSEAVTKSATHGFSDTVDSLTDAVALIPKLNPADLVSFTDSLVRLGAKSVSDFIAISEGIRFSSTKSIAQESAAASDAFSKASVQSRSFVDSIVFSETKTASTAKAFTDSATLSDAPAKTYYKSFLEGGEYAVSGYFESADYVVGGVAVGDSLTHTP